MIAHAFFNKCTDILTHHQTTLRFTERHISSFPTMLLTSSSTSHQTLLFYSTMLLAISSRSFVRAFVPCRTYAIRTSTRLFRRSRNQKNPSSSSSDGADSTTNDTNNSLDWENFDFSENPKWDERFGEDGAPSIASTWTEEFTEEYRLKEAQRDKTFKKELDEQLNALHSLDQSLILQAIHVLEPFVNEGRKERMDTVLNQRTQNCRFLFENPTNPSNVWACLRTIDSFGIQHVDVIIDSGMYRGKAAISQKRGMRTAMGSANWLTLRNYGTTENAIQDLKRKGYRILASDLNPSSKDIRDLKWATTSDNDKENQNENDTVVDDRPICIVMGNEGNGISEEMRSMADGTFTLPMCGFAESFNLSVATAITLAHLSAASKDGKGPLQAGDLDEHEFNCLRLKGLLNSLPQKRMGPSLLRKEGITLPEAIDWV